MGFQVWKGKISDAVEALNRLFEQEWGVHANTAEAPVTLMGPADKNGMHTLTPGNEARHQTSRRGGGDIAVRPPRYHKKRRRATHRTRRRAPIASCCSWCDSNHRHAPQRETSRASLPKQGSTKMYAKSYSPDGSNRRAVAQEILE